MTYPSHPQPDPLPPGYGPPGAAPVSSPGYPGHGSPAGYPSPVSAPGHSTSGPPYGAPGHGYAVPHGGYPPGYQGSPPGYPAPAIAPNGQPLAEFIDRFLARLIDVGIYLVVTLVLAIPLILVVIWAISDATTTDVDGTTSGPSGGSLVVLLLAEALYVIAAYVVQYLYEVEYMLRKNGQTVGKRSMKIRVVPIDPRESLTRGMLAKRWSLYTLVGACVPFFSLIDGLWQLWDKPYRQTLHDKFARTVVVKEQV